MNEGEVIKKFKVKKQWLAYHRTRVEPIIPPIPLAAWILAAGTDGKVRSWSQAPFTLKDMRRGTAVVHPSAGEEWRQDTVKDKLGRETTRGIHALGDSVIRARVHCDLSGMDETRMHRGNYSLARLLIDPAPASFSEALSFLKPKVVQDAEARGAYVRRQGEFRRRRTRAGATSIFPCPDQTGLLTKTRKPASRGPLSD
jgi:hypothetical protein